MRYIIKLYMSLIMFLVNLNHLYSAVISSTCGV